MQGQLQSVRDNANKLMEERNTLKKEMETKNQEVQEKVRTITQVKKIGRRYKTQYDELKVQHDKVRVCSPKFQGCIVQTVLLSDGVKPFYTQYMHMLIEFMSLLPAILYRWLLRQRLAQPRPRRLVKPQFRNCRASGIL